MHDSPIDIAALRRDLETHLAGEVRFDAVSRALYSTDASVYQIEPLGVVVPRTQEDIVRTVQLCRRHGCSLTMRGGGTSQAGQAIGAGLIVDTSKYVNRLLELKAGERWARVEPGIVLDDLNAALGTHGLRFAPDISTASRATVGGMMANNSSGARSVLYGKTIDHVLEQKVALSDGSVIHCRPLSSHELDAMCGGDTLEASCYREVCRLAREHAGEIERRYPKVLRRVGGYNLDAFVNGGAPFDLTKLMVGSEGTLGVLLEAKVALVPLPVAKGVLVVQFASVLEALDAAPAILAHRPSAVEIMDAFILDHTRKSAALERLRQTFIEGNPGALLCVELYADRAEDIAARLGLLERDLRALGFGYKYHRATEPAAQSAIWGVREAALGLSMAMKGDAKSLSFVEDTAVPPERLRDYISRFLAMIERHGTRAGVYAHASVGCLHVRPVVNLKTEAGVRQFEAIARESAALVLEYGGALSGEHGDGLVRSPFMEQMFGPELYQAFRLVKQTFDPHGILNPGKIVDAPPLTAHLRYGPSYRTTETATLFDYADYGGIAGAVEMCSGLGVCRKTGEGTMCPSYMATREEAHSTRGRANVLRLAIAGQLGNSGLAEGAVRDVLDLCLECRACKAECPVGVDVARFKSEFLAAYWQQHSKPVSARMFAHVHDLARWGSRLAPVSNWIAQSLPARWLNERLLGVDRRRAPPRWTAKPFSARFRARRVVDVSAPLLLFNDTFTKYLHPEVGLAASAVLDAAGSGVELAPNVCCGRPFISQGFLDEARALAASNTDRLFPLADRGRTFLFLEPSCLSAVKEDSPSLLRGDAQRRATRVADRAFLFEDWLEQECRTARVSLPLARGPAQVLFHGHCHQRAMGHAASARSLLARIPGATVVDLDAGCCGMAGSFGYSRNHYDVSRAIGERRLLPAVRAMGPSAVLVASGTSCRQQVADFTGTRALHAAELLHSLLPEAS